MKLHVEHSHANGRHFINDEFGVTVAETVEPATGWVARRLVACWNACEGNQTKILERICFPDIRAESAASDMEEMRALLAKRKEGAGE